VAVALMTAAMGRVPPYSFPHAEKLLGSDDVDSSNVIADSVELHS
jgi:hypothetical protein